MKRALLALAIATVFVLAPRTTDAAPIEYVVTDLGSDVWQYDYYLDPSLTFAGNEDGFAVFFAFDDTSNLQVLPGVTSEWDPLVEEPIVAALSDGYYDALALVDNPSFIGPFSVSFLWSGAGTPGSQAYELYKLDASGAPVAFASGFTALREDDENPAPVPEPSSLLLLGTGVAAALRKLRRTHARS
jgi:hypothetical protein